MTGRPHLPIPLNNILISAFQRERETEQVIYNVNFCSVSPLTSSETVSQAKAKDEKQLSILIGKKLFELMHLYLSILGAQLQSTKEQLLKA